ncbi:MAG: hypothetical protein ACE5G2_11155 [Candidatus Krumholzibacteriia bacterium]
MSNQRLAVASIVLVGLAACDRQPPPAPELGPDGQALVDVYVRLSLYEALHAQAPDSVNTGLDELRATYDSAAVHRALEALSAEPLRWERIYDVIAKRLTELEEDPDQWWNVARGDSFASNSSASGPAPDR